jgi:hypothetical protein
MPKIRFQPGDTVRVPGERGTSRIRSILAAVNGALLESEIGGYRSWNLDELRLVKRANLSKSRKVSEEVRTKLKDFWRKKKR